MDFSDYKEQFEETFNNALALFEKGQGLTGTDRSRAFANSMERLSSARGVLVSMNQTARSAGKVDELRNQLTDYENSLKNLTKDVQIAQKNSNSIKQLLSAADIEQKAKAQANLEKRILGTTKELINTSKILQNIEIDADDTYKIASSTLVQLQEDHEKLEGMWGKVEVISVKISSARKYIRDIWTTMSTGQLIRAGIILVLILACFLVIFMRWIYTNMGNSTTPMPTPMPVVNGTVRSS